MGKKIKRELAGGLPFAGLALVVGFGFALVLELFLQVGLTRWEGQEAGAWFGIAGIGMMVGALLTMLMCNIVATSTSFSMALSMGCTRRAYFISGGVAQLLLTLAAGLAAYPVAWADALLRRAVYGALPLDGGTLESANPILGMFHHSLWAVLLLAVSVVVVGQFFGAVVWKLGIKGYWIVWGASMVLGAVANRMSDAEEGSPLYGPRLLLKRVFMNFTTVHWALLWAAALVFLALCVWLLLRRAALK